LLSGIFEVFCWVKGIGLTEVTFESISSSGMTKLVISQLFCCKLWSFEWIMRLFLTTADSFVDYLVLYNEFLLAIKPLGPNP
jgi:hypothetical protein